MRARGRDTRPVRALSLETPDEGGRGARQPAVGDRVAQRAGGDLRQLDQDRGIPVEVRDAEEGGRVRGEHRFLLAEVPDPDGQDGPVRRGLIAEPPDIRLAERPVPGERLAADEPGPVAEPLPLGHLGQFGGHPGHIVESHHMATVPPRPPTVAMSQYTYVRRY